MIEKPDPKPPEGSLQAPGGTSSRARQARLEKALKDNLRRRKDQARRQTQVQTQAPGETSPKT